MIRVPIYEYECTSCGRRFERKEGFDAPAVNTCQACRGQAQRVISSVAVIYKGSGFYTTDYKRKEPSTNGHSEPGNSDKKSERAAAPAEPVSKKPSAPAES